MRGVLACVSHSKRNDPTLNNCALCLKATKKASMMSTDNALELGAGAVGRTSPGQAIAADDCLNAIVELQSRVQDEAKAWAEEARYRRLAPEYVVKHGQAHTHHGFS